MLIDRLHHFVLSELRRLMGATEGVVALIVALSILPVVTLAGAAVDLRRVSAARTNLQTTADAAALAGADALRRGGDAAAATAAATAFVNAAIVEGSSMRPTLASPPDVGATSVNVKLNMSVPMTLMKMARINEVSVKAEATAAYGANGGEGGTEAAEIVLALDTTGSMGLEGRLVATKDAAKKLIEKVMLKPDRTPDPTVRVGLVPFAQYVNVGLQYRNESWMWETQDYSVPARQSCGTAYKTWDPGPDRRIEKTCWNPDETSYDCSYYQQTWINPRDPYQLCSQYPAETHKWNGCVGSNPSHYWDSNWGQPKIYWFDEMVELFGGRFGDTKAYGILDVECANPLVRLTPNQGELNSSIDALTSDGFTYIAPAVLWSWRLLTRGQPFEDAKEAGRAIKSLVLMTDGANTRSHRQGYYVHDATAVDVANDKTLAVCANAKAAGIKIYTIGFMAPAEIKPVLRACASAPSNYYDAPSIPELQRVFTDIGSRMTALRLVK